jgi:hypothetical protein
MLMWPAAAAISDAVMFLLQREGQKREWERATANRTEDSKVKMYHSFEE